MKTMLACQIGHITCSSGRNSSAGCGEPARMVEGKLYRMMTVKISEKRVVSNLTSVK